MTTGLIDGSKIPITELEKSAFCQPESELKTSTLEEEFKKDVRWQKIPQSYLKLKAEELDFRISQSRARLKDQLVILGHHYQRAEIIKFADVRGDSFKLAQYAAAKKDAEYIVFCGVHFMAETADILSADNQKVVLPNLMAGCSMADMADTADVYDCWEDLSELLEDDSGITPITYMNSTAEIKSICGRNGGIVCTSSNAEKTFNWAYEKSDRILFLPDQHLGRNTGARLGVRNDQMLVWNPYRELGGHTEEAIRDAKLILWKGHCSVHTRFTVSQIEQARSTYPGIEIVVHPECTQDVVQASDFQGSTEYIINLVQKSPRGSSWAIGTEINLVNRLAQENPDKSVVSLDSVVCPCSTMYRIHPAYLLWVLDGLNAGVVINQIEVDQDTKNNAKLALERMLSLA